MSVTSYEDFIRETNKEEEIGALNSKFTSVLSAYGYDRAALCLNSDHEEIGLKSEIGIFTNIPEEWMNTYHRENMQFFDPVQIMAREKSTPFKWSDTSKEMKLSLKQQDFFRRLKKADLHDGYFIPLWGHNKLAGVGIARSVPDEDVDHENINLIGAYCRQYYECFLKLKRRNFLIHQKEKAAREEASSKPIVLTVREVEILKLAARGNKDQQIGTMLHLSPHTVDAHFRNIYKKLSSKSRTEAVACALSNHIIWL